MSNINLWQASEEYKSLCEQLYNSTDEDGVVDEEVFENMLAAKETLEGAVVAGAMVVRQYDKDIKSIDEEIERLESLKNGIKTKKDNLAKRISDACIKTGVESIKGVYANISFRSSKETVIDDEEILPDEYKKTTTKITISSDKPKIKEAILAGKDVPGAHIESKKNIQIK